MRFCKQPYTTNLMRPFLGEQLSVWKWSVFKHGTFRHITQRRHDAEVPLPGRRSYDNIKKTMSYLLSRGQNGLRTRICGSEKSGNFPPSTLNVPAKPSILMRQRKAEEKRHEIHDKRSPFLAIARAAIPVRNCSYATEQAYLGLIAPLQRHAVQNSLGATLGLKPRAVPEQAASRDSV